MNKQGPILFVDGDCLLCLGLVKFLLKLNLSQEVKFAPLQGQNAQQLLPPHSFSKLETVIFYQEDKILVKSKALLALSPYLPFPWSGVKIFKFIPLFIRDFIYTIVAKYRYKIFGRSTSCLLPLSENLRQRFLP